jgi:hypothetical protein
VIQGVHYEKIITNRITIIIDCWVVMVYHSEITGLLLILILGVVLGIISLKREVKSK